MLDSDTARACVDAGAQFIVSPRLDLPTIEACAVLSVPIFPSALTPTEILTAWRAGADVVKVLPPRMTLAARHISNRSKHRSRTSS